MELSDELPRADTTPTIENTFEILATGAGLPRRVVSNKEVAERLGIDVEWIVPRTGIHERRYISEGESTQSLVTEAARQAIEASGIAPSQIGVAVVATSTPDRLTPSTAVAVQQDLGLTSAWAFDVSAGCSGFIYALKLASSLLAEGSSEYALVVGAESLSRHIDWSDVKASALFGDGAGAVVLKRKKTGPVQQALFRMNSTSDESGDLLIGSQNAWEEGNFLFKMNGREVFRRAVTNIAESAQSLMQGLNLRTSHIKYFVCHQANSRILESVNEKLGFAREQVPVNIDSVGNTGAASIPILLHFLNRDGKLQKGDVLLLSAFGAGFTWASAILRW